MKDVIRLFQKQVNFVFFKGKGSPKFLNNFYAKKYTLYFYFILFVRTIKILSKTSGRNFLLERFKISWHPLSKKKKKCK